MCSCHTSKVSVVESAVATLNRRDSILGIHDNTENNIVASESVMLVKTKFKWMALQGKFRRRNKHLHYANLLLH